MKEKKTIQQQVPEDADLFEEIYGFMKQNAWVYISSELFVRLRNEYQYEEPSPSRICLKMQKHRKEWEMYVYWDCDWNKVLSLYGNDRRDIRESEHYNARDPELIVFLY